MPIYEYRCEDCQKKFEKFVRYPDRETVECPACGKANLTQLISAFRAHEPGKLKPAPTWSKEHGTPEERHEHAKEIKEHAGE
jgi:putative FmdB family regulatory protein